MKHIKIRKLLAAILICLMGAASVSLTVSASTDGNPLQVTDEPARLELNLGTAWAGTEFRLETDAGTFPVPVIVSENGVLQMELDDSKLFSLTVMETSPLKPESGISSPEHSVQPHIPSDGNDVHSTEEEASEVGPVGASNVSEDAGKDEMAIPPLHIILFISGLVFCITILVIMAVMKRRRNAIDVEEDDDYDYDGDED